MKIIVKKFFQFGHERYFPVNDVAETILSLMPRRNTFFSTDLEKLQTLDFEIEIEKEEFKMANRLVLPLEEQELEAS